MELARAAAALRVLSDEFCAAGDALGKVGSASIAVHDIASVGNQGSMYTYPDPMEVADATELARKELVRIQNLFKVQIQDIEKPIDPLVEALSTDKILNHILVPKHNFDRVLTNLKSEEGLRRLLSVVQDKGTLRSFNKPKMIYEKFLDIQIGSVKERIFIRGKLLANGIDIGTAWIQ